jgi:signal transduction histidine kinase
MLRTELLKSTAFRLALFFSGLFLVSFVVAGFLAYSFIKAGLDERLDQSVADTVDIISQSYGDGDFEDLTATVARYAAIFPDHDAVFYLMDPTGKVIAGNVTAADVPGVISSVGGSRFGLAEEGSYRAIKQPLGFYTLAVGMNYSETDALARVAITSFAWAGALACIVAIAGGAWLAGTVQSRLQAIGTTMGLVGQGELTARIPLRGAGDDVDVLANQVNAALDRLSALVESMRQVSVDIAHDLRTPLNRLAMTIEGALEKADKGENNSAELSQAQEECLQIDATFQALLRIAQLESGARRERFVPVSMTHVLDLLFEAYADVALESGQTLEYSPSTEVSPMVFGDRDLLTQLFANLIENAIRHAARGQIWLSLSLERDRVVVSVADDGPGIPSEERARVFQRLYRLEKSRTTPGTGLGLSLVKAIADIHGAKIVLSDRSPGLQVSVAFPRAPANSPGAKPPSQSPSRKVDAA